MRNWIPQHEIETKSQNHNKKNLEEVGSWSWRLAPLHSPSTWIFCGAYYSRELQERWGGARKFPSLSALVPNEPRCNSLKKITQSTFFSSQLPCCYDGLWFPSDVQFSQFSQRKRGWTSAITTFSLVTLFAVIRIFFTGSYHVESSQ